MLQGRWGPDSNLCPLCEIEASKQVQPENLRARINCKTCGRYEISLQAANEINVRDHPAFRSKHVLSGLAREASESGRYISITTENVSHLLESVATPEGPLEAMDRVLMYLSRNQSTVADRVRLGPEHYPIAFCKDSGELRYCLDYLDEQNTIEWQPVAASEPVGFGRYCLTPSGWQRVLELQKAERKSDQAFVAMWFNDELEPAWQNGFHMALVELGYEPIRIDLVPHNDKICDRIIAEIRRSGLLVADMTGNRGGVYFEAGFAMGLGIPVIWTCRQDHINNVHFDTRQYNHIVWTDADDLREKLTYRIEATIPGRVRRP